MNDTNQPKSDTKPRKRRKYITKEERRRNWGQGIPVARREPDEKGQKKEQ